MSFLIAAVLVQFAVGFGPSVRTEPVTGRVFVLLSHDSVPEPRYQGGTLGANAPFFGQDVTGLAPGHFAVLGTASPGFPCARISDLPPGDYYVQAVLSVYTQFHRADGHTIWAHMDQWEGQHPMESPGNLVSRVKRVHIAPNTGTIRLELTDVIPPITVPSDTKWIKHIKIQSEILSKFWGHPMYLGAVVLLPSGYDEHPDQSYPVDYEQDHFSLSPPYHFQSEDPGTVDSTKEGHRAWVINLRRREGYRLYQDWTSDSFPRMLMVTFLHPTPYFDDSYAVNSANNGPYGDAIMQELIPYIESRFRIIRQPYARVLSGGSTGGWESLALQVQHPDFFGGAWVYYPDPVDFREWGLVDIYNDSNAFMAPGAHWVIPERPMMRSADGQVLITERQESQLEAALGSHGRSAEQEDAWEVVYGPVGTDGYPVPLWDKRTGVINHDVARYMRDHGYDLTAYLRENWSRLSNQLGGKLHFYVGDMDNFYLNMAVYRADTLLHSSASFDYGRPAKGHGFRPTSTGDMLRAMARQIANNASTGGASR
ncbi:MAG TPA: alpha/beta hydrolase-fold protein [Gemmatimonadaceae bacterium]|nr:alpha/beta hydrolase-fold protein [Gemmatimonadaceae bacterium]